MYWNPMSNWADWFTTTLAIVSWGVMVCLVVYALREGFRADPDPKDDFVLEPPHTHRMHSMKAKRTPPRSAVRHD